MNALKFWFILSLLGLTINGNSQNGSDYIISKNEKNTFSLYNKTTNKTIRKNCTSIDSLSKFIQKSNVSTNDYLLLAKNKKLMIYNTYNDAIVIEVPNEADFTVNEIGYYKEDIYKGEISYEKSAELPIVVIKCNNGEGYFSILLNLNTSKVLQLLPEGDEVFYSNKLDRLFVTSTIFSTLLIKVIDFNGRIIVPYTSIGTIFETSNGYITNNDDLLTGIVDKNGATIVPFIYNDFIPVNKDLFIAKDSTGKTGVINSRGEILIPFIYCNTHPNYYPRLLFSDNGLFVFYKDNFSDGNFVIIDTTNSVLSPTGKYSDITDFRTIQKRFFIVESKEEKYGIFDSYKKTEIFPPIYNFFNYKFESQYGILQALYQGKWGVLDLNNGKILVPFEFQDEGEYFLEETFDKRNFFIAKKKGKKGVIDITGNIIVPFDFEDVFLSSNQKYFIIQKDDLFGLMNAMTFKYDLPIEYNKITKNIGVEKLVDGVYKSGYYEDNAVKWKK